MRFAGVPGSRLISLTLCLGVVSLVLAIVEAVWPALGFVDYAQSIVPGAAVALVGVVFFDWWTSRQFVDLQLQRQLPATMAVNKNFPVALVVAHGFPWPVTITLHERLPEGVLCPVMPLRIDLQPGASSTVDYQAKAVARGDLIFTECLVRIPSRWKLWQFDRSFDLPAKARVYPDFSAIAAYSLLATDNHTSQIGIKKRQRRGEGTEFHQLREYRQGDSLRQVDWKATSRKSKIISRDYSDERDQEIVLLVDAGRRMRAKDDELSHFDHSLNALLLVSYIALRQGDSVSVMTFGSDNRWIPRQKGPGQVQSILNAVYDLHPGRAAADYIGAAQRLARLQTKRALVMLVSNCRDEDVDDLLVALQLLRKRHVVLLANLREGALDERLRQQVDTFEHALEYAGVNHYLASRDNAQQHLRSRGTLVLDCTPHNLPEKMANAYLEIKRAGLL